MPGQILEIGLDDIITMIIGRERERERERERDRERQRERAERHTKNQYLYVLNQKYNYVQI